MVFGHFGLPVHEHSRRHEILRAWRMYMGLRREFADVETLAIFYDGERLFGPDGGRDRQIVLALNLETGVAGVGPFQATLSLNQKFHPSTPSFRSCRQVLKNSPQKVLKNSQKTS